MKWLVCILLLASGLGKILAQDTSKIVFQDGISLTGITMHFEPRKHIIDTCHTNLDRDVYCLINGIPWFGSDFGTELPKNQLSSLILTISGVDISLDVTGMFNPNYSGRLGKHQFKLKTTLLGYTLHGFFSDGAGSYTVQWEIIKDQSIRTRISRDERDFEWQRND